MAAAPVATDRLETSKDMPADVRRCRRRFAIDVFVLKRFVTGDDARSPSIEDTSCRPAFALD
jgi:hypothetical protein